MLTRDAEKVMWRCQAVQENPVIPVRCQHFAQSAPANSSTRENSMNIQVAAQPLIALIAGILILIMPRLLNYVIAVYLIVVGLIGLLPLLR